MSLAAPVIDVEFRELEADHARPENPAAADVPTAAERFREINDYIFAPM